MHTLLTRLLVISLCLSFTACVKKQFAQLAEPTSLTMAPGIKSIPILAEPLKEERVIWKKSAIENIPVEGLLRVTYKEKDYFYVQMLCPKALKCNGSKVYVPLSMTYDPNFYKNPFRSYYKVPEKVSFILAPAEKLTALREFHDWLVKPGRVLPTVFDGVLLKSYLRGLKQPAQAKRMAELFLLSRLIHKQEYTERRAPMLHYHLNLAKPKKKTANKSGVVLKKTSFTEKSTVTSPKPEEKYTDSKADASQKSKQSKPKPDNKVVEKKEPEFKPFAGLTEEQKTFANRLHQYTKDEYNDTRTHFLLNFPYSARDNKKLARVFNRLDDALMYKEAILKKLTAATPYYVDGVESIHFFNAKPQQIKNFLVETPDVLARFKKPEVKEKAPSAKTPAPTTGTSQPGKTPAGTTLPMTAPADKLDIEPVNKELTSTFDYAKGFQLSFSIGEKPQTVAVSSVRAFGTEKGLGFELQTPRGKLRLQPAVVPEYLKKVTSADIKKIAQELPAYRELVKENKYINAAMLLALKYGEGLFDREERRFTYTIDMGKKSNFWKVLALIKSHPSISADRGTFKGKVRIAGEEITWYQKKSDGPEGSTFRLTGKHEMCVRDCFSEPFDRVCFSEGEKFMVTFTVADLLDRDKKERKPTISFCYGDGGSDQDRLSKMCNNFFGKKDKSGHCPVEPHPRAEPL